MGRRYGARRATDPRIAAAVDRALGEARRVLNVGAGTGPYEPDSREVTAVSRAQAPAAISRAEPELRQVASSIYKAQVPVEWAHDFELEGEGEAPYYPMQFNGSGEAGQPYVRLEGQYPAAVADPVEGEEGPHQTTSELPDYREISFGPIVLGGRRMVRWNYDVEGDRRVVYGLTTGSATLRNS